LAKPSKATNSKKIVKAPKLTSKEKLEIKHKPTQKKPNLVAFHPNVSIEEAKAINSGEKPLAKRPKKGERNYYQNFDFYFKRTCFRTMTLYFKTAYKPFFDKSKSKKKKGTVLESLIAFTNKEFPGLLETMSEKARFEFVELVKLLVLSHRHNKNDDFLKDPLIDFNIVREPMYKYSKQAQDKFFNLATYAFLFSWFESNP